MPSDGVPSIPHDTILRYEEIVFFLKVAVDAGVRKIRITGGEPLVRKNVPHLIRMIKTIAGIKDLSMTTNGVLLDKYAQHLAAAGLTRINISLDSLVPEKYRSITRGGSITSVFRGIRAAEQAGFTPIKINMIPIRGLNDDEIQEFARLTIRYPYQVRFIEYMPFGLKEMWRPERFLSAEQIQSIVEELGPLVPASVKKSGPARHFKLKGSRGIIGFISPLSNHFCHECNRLRLTADGKLRPCLFSETEINLRPALKTGDVRGVMRLIELSAASKPEGHALRTYRDHSSEDYLTPVENFNRRNDFIGQRRPMSGIGG
jgi:cyclic pyranopterin phosphate synthase